MIDIPFIDYTPPGSHRIALHSSSSVIIVVISSRHLIPIQHPDH